MSSKELGDRPALGYNDGRILDLARRITALEETMAKLMNITVPGAYIDEPRIHTHHGVRRYGRDA